MMTFFWKRRAAVISRKEPIAKRGRPPVPSWGMPGPRGGRAPGVVVEIAGGNEVADDVEESRHGLARENVAGEKDAGKKGQKGELDGFGLRLGFAGDENADGKRNKKVRNGKES